MLFESFQNTYIFLYGKLIWIEPIKKWQFSLCLVSLWFVTYKYFSKQKKMKWEKKIAKLHDAAWSNHRVTTSTLSSSSFSFWICPDLISPATMKQLHKQMSSKRDDDTIPMSQSSPYSPKALKHPRSLPRSLHYLFREQRLLFILVGILIGSTFFILQPSLSRLSPAESTSLIARSASSTNYSPSRMSFNYGGGKTGRVPVGINPRRLRIVVTGGAGFVGSHLVDKLIGRGDEVIVIDNFFTGRKENLVHLFSNPRFELIRHDVVEPILLEVDQIYHLACPASPVHYKFNPVKTIISFWLILYVLLLWILIPHQ